MPKREPSPVCEEIENYFAVYKPYPLDADWNRREDYIACCRWIVTCLGIDNSQWLHTLLYKPSTGVIVLVIDKAFTNHRLLLGRHNWSDFLTEPSERENGNFSQIYYSFEKTAGAIRKAGWKRIDVYSAWFQNWDPSADFVLDRPATTWCDLPREDVTNRSHFRHIPLDRFPEVAFKLNAQPVVGSIDWVNSPNVSMAKSSRKKRGKLNAASLVLPERTAWDKPISENKKPSMSLAVNASRSPAPNGSMPGESVTASQATSAWNRPLLSMGDYPEPPGLGHRTPATSAPKLDNKVPLVPPGLTKSDNSSAPSSFSWRGQKGPVSDSEEFSDEALEDEYATVSGTYGDEGESYFDTPSETVFSYPWENSALENHGLAQDENVILWDSETPEKGPEATECPHHGYTCRKGLCKWRSDEFKKAEKMKKEEERMLAKQQKLKEKKLNCGGQIRGPGTVKSSKLSDYHGSEDGTTVVSRCGDDGSSVLSGATKCSNQSGWRNTSRGRRGAR